MSRYERKDAKSVAEAAFRTVTQKPKEEMPKAPVVPGAKELVSIRIDRDILDYFQEEGPGWQDRIVDALREVARSSRLSE
jgi:uncharacterized protein (DUF4415 family)